MIETVHGLDRNLSEYSICVVGHGSRCEKEMMYERLVLMRELLSENGTIFVHVGWLVSHYVKAVLDDVFGNSHFLNQVIWKRQTAHSDIGQGSKHLGRIHDVIFLYTKSDNFTWNMQFEPYSKEYVKNFYKHREPKTGRIYRLSDLTAPGGASKGNPHYEFLGVTRYWRFSENRMKELYAQGRIVQTRSGTVPAQKRYLDEMPGVPLQDLWLSINTVQPQSAERQGYDTQKPEALLEYIVKLCSNENDLVADFFCGSGTTGAVAEKLGRRWIMCDLGRFAIHTSRKRLIGTQRTLHDGGKKYRSFDVYNLGRYERQWWQKDRLKGADEDHRRVVMEFYRAEPLPNAIGLLHGRKGPVFVHVDAIDSIFTRDELRAVVRAAREAGAKEVHCLAWEFEMDLRLVCLELEAAEGIKIKLIPIPREIMEKNRTNPPPFLEVAVLEAAPVYRKEGGKRTVDVKLTKFLPSPAEVPSKELETLK